MQQLSGLTKSNGISGEDPAEEIRVTPMCALHRPCHCAHCHGQRCRSPAASGTRWDELMYILVSIGVNLNEFDNVEWISQGSQWTLVDSAAHRNEGAVYTSLRSS